MKRALVLLAALALLLFATMAVAEAKTFTEAEIAQKLEDLRTTLEGKYFTVTGESCTTSYVSGHYCENCNVVKVIAGEPFRSLIDFAPTGYPNFVHYRPGHSSVTNGWSCAGFANYAGWYLFADTPSDKVTFEDIYEGYATEELIGIAKPGDVLGFVRDGRHSGILYEMTDTSLTILDCNNTYKDNCVVKLSTYTFASGTNRKVTVNRATNYAVETEPAIPFDAHAYMDETYIADRLNSFVAANPLGTAYTGSYDGQGTHIGYVYACFDHVFGTKLKGSGYNMLCKGSSVSDIRSKVLEYKPCPGSVLWLKDTDDMDTNALMVLLAYDSSGVTVLFSDKNDGCRTKVSNFTWSEMSGWLSGAFDACYFESPSIRKGSSSVDGPIELATATFTFTSEYRPTEYVKLFRDSHLNYPLDEFFELAYPVVIDSYVADEVLLESATIENPDIASIVWLEDGTGRIRGGDTEGETVITVRTKFGLTASLPLRNYDGCHYIGHIRYVSWQYSAEKNAIFGVCDGCAEKFTIDLNEASRLPEDLRTIEAGAFTGADLQDVVLPDSVISIEADAFTNMPGLRAMKLSGDINIDMGAFDDHIGNMVFVVDRDSRVDEFLNNFYTLIIAYTDGTPSETYSFDYLDF